MKNYSDKYNLPFTNCLQINFIQFGFDLTIDQVHIKQML